ncbi:hypothetical protein ACPV3A_07785 [Paenibacillus sp. Dod16]|uniref:hypothetical protein n=1 Tax=Paenibacillus sp. Dod16 TaxID=3416392 RepID=UPI003CF26B40
MRIVLCLSLLLLLNGVGVHADNASAPSKEQLLEEALITQYLPILGKAIDEATMCEWVSEIHRIQGSNRAHKVTISSFTYHGPHNPPHDLITVTLADRGLGNITILNVDRKTNVDMEDVRNACRR